FGEFLGDRVRIESDAGRVGADEGAAENATGPAREIVPLERFEVADADLGVCGNGGEGDVPALTFATQAASERVLTHRHVSLDARPTTIGSRTSLARLA